MVLLGTRQLFKESIPIASIILFWTILSWLGITPTIAKGFRVAGIVMATMYVVVRGTSIDQPQGRTQLPADLSTLLMENARIAFPVGFWFFAAVVVSVLESYWDRFGLVGFGSSPAESFVFVFTATGVGVATLYAVAAILPRISGSESNTGIDESANVSGDD